jgi:hypothetical protein
MLKHMRNRWQARWKQHGFRLQLLLTVLALFLVLHALASFLTYVEVRPGAVLPDPLLALFQARDFTWVTFAVIYGGILLGLLNLASFPAHLVLAIQSYVVMVLFRIMAMYLVPLEPPPGMILLRDPLVEVFGTGIVLTKDLFFSGHTATMLILALTAPQPWLRKLFLVCTIAVAVLVLWQHVHYSIDVLIAPVFALLAYQIALLAHRKPRSSLES